VSSRIRIIVAFREEEKLLAQLREIFEFRARPGELYGRRHHRATRSCEQARAEHDGGRGMSSSQSFAHDHAEPAAERNMENRRSLSVPRAFRSSQGCRSWECGW
jgi:hypothetical protein